MEKKRYIIPHSSVLAVDMGSLMDAYVSKTENGPDYGGDNNQGMNGAKQSSFTNFWSDSDAFDEEE